MAEAHLVSTLERHCLELEKRSEDYRLLKARAESDLLHLRSTIEFIERSDGIPGAKVPSMSVARIFKRGEAFALCENALRNHGPELSTSELAEVCMRAANLDTANIGQRRAMMQLLIEILRLRRQTGEIVMTGRKGKVCLWRLPS